MLNYKYVENSEYVVEEYLINDMMCNDLTYNNLYSDKNGFKKVLTIAGIASCVFITDGKASNLKLNKKIDDNLIVSNYLNRNNEFDFLDEIYNTETKIASKPKDNFTEIVKDIISFQDLKKDWDGYGAYPLNNKSGVNSINILQKLGSDCFNIIDDYYPNPSGTLSIMWDFTNSILELEVGNQEFSYYFKVYDTNETKYFYAKEFNESNINELKSNLHKVIKNK